MIDLAAKIDQQYQRRAQLHTELQLARRECSQQVVHNVIISCLHRFSAQDLREARRALAEEKDAANIFSGQLAALEALLSDRLHTSWNVLEDGIRQDAALPLKHLGLGTSLSLAT